MSLLILDRDGVINEESNNFIKEPEEWRPIPGSLEAIASAYREGFRIVVVTNQSGLGRGVLDIDALNRIHKEMHRQVVTAGGASMPFSSVRTPPKIAAHAASPIPACTWNWLSAWGCH